MQDILTNKPRPAGVACDFALPVGDVHEWFRTVASRLFP
jgi:hypothetical protein